MRQIAWGCSLLIGFFMISRIVLRHDVEPVQRVHADETHRLVTPVEADMHEFMEYVFEPPYKRLKAALATAPMDNSVWKGVKSDALILAESGNLLFGRSAAEDSKDWDRHAEAVRMQGGLLYQAAKKKDAPEARKRWEALLTSCNACHNQFAGGEHILTP